MLQKVNRYFIPFIFLISLYLVFNRHSRSEFNNYHSVNWADAAGYYVYLPAFFLYDFKASSFPENIEERTGHGFKLDSLSNKVFTKYNYGVAFLQSPFFLTAHIISKLFKWEANGYTKVYFRSVMIASVTYLMLGLFFLKKVLQNYFSNKIAMLSLFMMYTGTNLYYYAINSSGYSHIYSFAGFAMMVYLTDLFYRYPDFKKAIGIGVISGLIVIIRPTNCIFLLFFILYNVQDAKGLMERFLFFRKNIFLVICIVVFSLLMISPQLFYWKYASGAWFFDAYQNESFTNLCSPKIPEVLFSTNNGWILYTPLVLLIFAGIFLMIKNKIKNGILISCILTGAIFIYSSWWCWWYGCAFGGRSFVEYYAVLSIPFACLISKIDRGLKLLKVAAFIFCGICIYLNLNTIYHYDDCWYGGTWDWKEYIKIISR